ncbi:hypothetical protein Dimus_017936, partial [Dionaea muscipula]
RKAHILYMHAWPYGQTLSEGHTGYVLANTLVSQHYQTLPFIHAVVLGNENLGRRACSSCSDTAVEQISS